MQTLCKDIQTLCCFIDFLGIKLKELGEFNVPRTETFAYFKAPSTIYIKMKAIDDGEKYIAKAGLREFISE